MEGGGRSTKAKVVCKLEKKCVLQRNITITCVVTCVKAISNKSFGVCIGVLGVVATINSYAL